VVSTLNRKLLRDVLNIKGQVATVAIVVACGVASYVTLQSTWRSLQISMNSYYGEYRFANLFTHLERAPQWFAPHLQSVPGVRAVYPRVVDSARIIIEGSADPAIARLVSIPDGGSVPMNDLFLRRGRWPRSDANDEALLLEPFARVHGLRVGDKLVTIIHGVRRTLRIVGIALSPEFVLSAAEGDITVDDRRFAVVWMRYRALAPAVELDGAFNDVSFRLERGASTRKVSEAVDRLLMPYGGRGAYDRKHQLSHRALSGELEQLKSMATVVPTIFLAVAIFLVNVVLTRLIQLQRTQIAVLRAVGYSNRQVAFHFVKLVCTILFFGTALGIALGVPLGRGMTSLYGAYFRFPAPHYELGVTTPAVATLVSIGAALCGAYWAIRRMARLSPAEAMQPAPPVTYRRSLFERVSFVSHIAQVTLRKNEKRRSGQTASLTFTMLRREVLRFPLRTSISCVAIALAIAILISGQFMADAVRYFVDIYFSRSWREDVAVSFLQPRSLRVLHELRNLPGVQEVEGARVLPVRVHYGHRQRDGILTGELSGARLRRIVEPSGHVAAPHSAGAIITRKLAEVLHVKVGDMLVVEVLEREHKRLHIGVTGLVDELAGLQLHVSLHDLSRLTGDRDLISSAFLRLDSNLRSETQRRLQEMPGVATITRRRAVIDNFIRQTGKTMSVITWVLTIFAASITIGVIYNNARVALSVRYRDFATLHVLGFTRMEISRIFLAELAFQTLVAIPVGLLLGRWLSMWMMSINDPEVFRFPIVISSRTQAFAVTTTLCAAIVSALFVRRRIDAMQPAEALKTRE